VSKQLDPLSLAPAGSLVGVVDDDGSRRGQEWAGLRVMTARDAIDAGARTVVITAEGGAQDAMWAKRRVFRDAGMRVFCVPPRFASRTWDDCLAEHEEYRGARALGIDVAYARGYPAKDMRPPGWLLGPLEEHVREGMTVLEIGTGAGMWTGEIIDRASHYHAVDYSERLLFEVMETRFADRLDRLTLHHDETARMPGVPDESVDLAFSFDVFVHFKIDLVHQYLRSLRRVLRPGGTLLLHLVEWNEAAMARWARTAEAEHVGGHSIMFYNDPKWIEASCRALELRCETIARMEEAYLVRVRPATGR
jgi:SAM-dependent methyltransferase